MQTGRTIAVAVGLALSVIVSSASAQPEITTVEQLRAAAATGGAFTLPAGSIFIDEPVEVTSELSITGVGNNGSILIVRGAKAGLIVQPGAILTLIDVWVDGGPMDTPGGADLIQVAGRLVMRGGRVSGGRFEAVSNKRYGLGSGVYLAVNGSATLLEVALERNALAAVEVANAARVEMAGSLVRANYNGVVVEDDANATLISNYFDRNVAVALTIRGRAVATVDSNVFEGNGQRLDERGNAYDAVRIGGTAQVILSRNRFNDNPRFGLSLFDNAVVSASGNVYEGNGGYSQIDTQYHSSVLVGDEASYTGSNDRFVGNVGGALELDDNARAELTEAVVSGNGSNAAMFLDDTSSLTLVDVHVVDNEGPIVSWAASSLTVRGGRFEDGAGHAFYLAGGASHIEGAEVRGHGGVAVRTSFTATVTLVRNVIADNHSGIVFLDDSRGDVRDNLVTNNLSNGIAFADRSAGVASGNTVVHSPAEGLGIFVAQGLEVALEGNAESVP